MATTNAFDLLILPMLQWTGGIYAAFAMIRLIQVALGHLVKSGGRRPEPRFARESALLAAYRPASPRANRPHVRAASPTR